MRKQLLVLAVLIAPSAVADTLTLSAALIEPEAYAGFANYLMTVAPNPNSPVPGTDAELSFSWSYTETDPIGCVPMGSTIFNSCFWSFQAAGAIAPSIVSPTYLQFVAGGDFAEAGNNFDVVGAQSGTFYDTAGIYAINLQVELDYGTDSGTIPPPNPEASITLQLDPIFGSISIAPHTVATPEPASWLLLSVVAALWLITRVLRRARRTAVD